MTQPGRTIRNALDSFLGDGAPAQRSLLLVVEPSASVAWSDFDKEWKAALERNSDNLAAARLGLAFLDDSPGALQLDQKPANRKPGAKGPDPFAAMIAAVERKLAAAKNETSANWWEDSRPCYDVHQALRTAAKSLAGNPKPQRVLVVAFDSADTENDLEGAGKLLKKQGVVVDFLTIESIFADGYWRSCASSEYRGSGPTFLLGNLHRELAQPSSGALVGGDGPIQDMPSGFLFQDQDGACITPSGFGSYSCNRLAHLTGGRVFLYASPKHTGHFCILFGQCLDCPDLYHWPDFGGKRHKKHDDAYMLTKVQTMAPTLAPRAEAAKAWANDPHAKATRKAWQAAYDAGILATSPPVLDAKGTTKPRFGNSRFESARQLLSELDPKTHLPEAQRLLQAADTIAASLGAELDALHDLGDPRQVAIARYTWAMLHLTRAGLLGFLEFSPTIPARIEAERASIADQVRAGALGSDEPQSILSSLLSVCHGLAGHVRRAPEGERRKALAELASGLANFERIAGGTPVGYAFHRAGLPEFRITYPGVTEVVTGPRPGAEPGQGPRTPRGPGSATPAGPTTGGGR